MAVQLTAPGVYVQEIPSGVRTITGVATSITAFIGRTRRGPVDRPITIFSFADFEQQCGGLWADSELSQAVRQFYVNGGGQALIVRVVNDSEDEVEADRAATATVSLADSGGDPLVLHARSPGTWGNSLRATVSYDTGAAIGEADAATQQFHLTIDEIDTEAYADSGNYEASVLRRERFRFLAADPTSSRFVQSVLDQQSRLVRVQSLCSTRPDEAPAAAFTGGQDGVSPTAAQVESAISLLDLADLVNLVVVPPFNDDPVPASVYTAALAWCESNRAMLLIDPPASWSDYQSAADLTDFTGLRSPNSAFFYPRLLAPDPLKDNLARDFPPAAAIAGLMARIDGSRGVWKSPAGLEATIRGTAGLQDTLTDDRIGVMNARGVNALRSLPVTGPVLWGARTGNGADTMASEWKYLAVRRLALYIEESLFRGLQWAVFEPNDEPLWAQIRLAVGTFMQNLFRQGALQGSRPSEAWQVHCDATTTTQADIDLGIVNVLVAFAPLKPAEFVVLKFQQIAGQSST